MLEKPRFIVAFRAVLLIHGALFALACASGDSPRSSTEAAGGDNQILEGNGTPKPEPVAGNGAQTRGSGGNHDSTGRGGAQDGFAGAPEPHGSGGAGEGGGAGAGNGGYQSTSGTGGRQDVSSSGGSQQAGGSNETAGHRSVAAGGNNSGATGGNRSGNAGGNQSGASGGSNTTTAGSGGRTFGAGGSSGPDLQWRKANLTNYESYPAPDSEECREYNGCTWKGQFAALDGVQPESWVQANNIIAVHEKDFSTYKLKTLRLRMGTKQIDAKVYDMCSDSDCDGCCTANSKTTGFLIDIEKYSMERFGTGDGIVEWACLDCN